VPGERSSAVTIVIGVLLVVIGYALALLTFVVVQYAAGRERRASRRWLKHVHACRRCWAVFQSDGPTWLYCEEGRARGEKATGARWCDLRDVLRQSDGVPAPRKERWHVH